MNNTAVSQNQVKKLFKNNMFTRRVISTAGKLNPNRLASYKTSKRLFTRPQERGGKAYNVELLIDYSGSIWRRGRQHGLHAAAESIAKALGKYCKLNLVLFNYLEEKVDYRDYTAARYVTERQDDYITELEQDGKRFVVDNKMLKCYPQAKVVKSRHTLQAGGGNWEIANVMNAANRLKKAKGNKIIIILLDGRMHLDWHDNNSEIMIAGHSIAKNPISSYRQTIEKLSKDNLILAFGIETREPEQFYPNFALIDNPNQTIDVVVNQLIKHLKI